MMRLGGAILVVLIASSLLLVGNLHGLSSLQGDAAAINYAGLGRMRCFQLLYLAHELPDDPGEARSADLVELRSTMNLLDDRFARLLEGDAGRGIPAATDPGVRASIVARRELWDARIKPTLERLMANPSAAEASDLRVSLDSLLRRLAREIDEETVRHYQQDSERKLMRLRRLQFGLLAGLFVISGGIVWQVWRDRRRILSLVVTSRRIAGGDLALRTSVNSFDEIGVVAEAFNEMTDELTALVGVRDEFVAIASHELKTPLSSLVLELYRLEESMPKMVCEKSAERERAVSLLHRAIRQTDRLANLINDLLDASRIGAGKIDLRYQEMDLSEVVHGVASRLREDAERVGCELVLPTNARIEGTWDPLRIEQVVTNLLSNAIKYAPGKPIEVSLESAPTTATLRVHDHGPGISADRRAQIFDRFMRGVGGRAPGGFGLGLYITRQIVEAHGGKIDVESQIGTGSTFVIELPRQPRLA